MFILLRYIFISALHSPLKESKLPSGEDAELWSVHLDFEFEIFSVKLQSKMFNQ